MDPLPILFIVLLFIVVCMVPALVWLILGILAAMYINYMACTNGRDHFLSPWRPDDSPQIRQSQVRSIQCQPDCIPYGQPPPGPSCDLPQIVCDAPRSVDDSVNQFMYPDTMAHYIRNGVQMEGVPGCHMQITRQAIGDRAPSINAAESGSVEGFMGYEIPSYNQGGPGPFPPGFYPQGCGPKCDDPFYKTDQPYREFERNGASTDCYDAAAYDYSCDAQKYVDIDAKNAVIAQLRQRDKKCSDGWLSKNANYFRKNFGKELDYYENAPWWGRNEV